MEGLDREQNRLFKRMRALAEGATHAKCERGVRQQTARANGSKPRWHQGIVVEGKVALLVTKLRGT